MTGMAEPDECVLCERVWAVIGLILGAAVIGIGIDTLTGGKLTRLIVGAAPRLASVTQIHGAEDETA